MTSYAELADLYAYGLPQAAMGSLTLQQQQSALDSRNAWADGKLRGRYQLPLVSWDVDLRMAVAQLAAYDLLVLRGYNPESGADQNIRMRYDDALAWFNGVERGNVHPNVTASADATGTKYTQPQVLTSPLRGWR